jgi:rhamnosyltransferase
MTPAPLHHGPSPDLAATVMAVVVTYHPPPSLAGHLRAIRAQVDALVVVDNASPDATAIEALTLELGGLFIGNTRNEGIARALNQGVERARAGGHGWLAMFDQDSEPPEGMVAGLVALAARHPEPAQVGIVASGFRDRNLGISYHDPGNTLRDGPDWREVRSLITSGSLVRVAAFDNAGLFDEGLFIDFVDHDHCLRLRRAGWRLLQSKSIAIDHAIGAQTRHRFLGRTVHCSNHSVARRYYMTRNQLEFYRRCLRDEPYWALWGLGNLLMRSLLTVMYETPRGPKAWAIVQGAWHFVIRRFGPR